MKFCLDCNKPKSRKGNYCKPCGYKHRIRPKGIKYTFHVINRGWFKKGQVSPNKGKPSPLKKDNPGYDALHEWVERWVEDPRLCEKCGSTKNLEWSNKSGEYMRNKSDWQRLCKKCHHRYDFEKFGARKVFFKGGNPTL